MKTILNAAQTGKAKINRFPICISVVLIILQSVGSAYGQDNGKAIDDQSKPDSTSAQAIQSSMDTLKAEVKKRDWNEVDFGFTTVRLGVALMHDLATYSQDATGKAQMDSANVSLDAASKFRDFRFLGSGRLNTKRPITWKIAIMYDGDLENWTFRETGLLVGIPELNSNVFIGRSKEGYSMVKVQNGYSPWTNERQMSLDLISIMTDGIRWYGYLPKSGFLWSIGAFSNLLYGHSKFMLYEWTYSGRVGWLPIRENTDKKLLYLGSSFRYVKPDKEEIRVKSRPESNPAPYFIDTGTFESDRNSAIGGEIYYRSGPWMLGSEVNVYHFNSTEAASPTFFGGDVSATYFFTGETRPWIQSSSVFHFVDPLKPLFDGGFGALELSLHLSTFKTNDGLRPGGDFWKFTSIINWYPTVNFRVQLVYGYGELDRFNLIGKTNFFQTRFQFQLL